MTKTILVSALVAFSALTMVSCKKDYTCTCKVSGQTITIPFNDTKKSTAQSSCDAALTTYKNGDPNATCSL